MGFKWNFKNFYRDPHSIGSYVLKVEYKHSLVRGFFESQIFAFINLATNLFKSDYCAVTTSQQLLVTKIGQMSGKLESASIFKPTLIYNPNCRLVTLIKPVIVLADATAKFFQTPLLYVEFDADFNFTVGVWYIPLHVSRVGFLLKLEWTNYI